MAYSSVNYKDALAATGAGKIIGASRAWAASTFRDGGRERRPALQGRATP